ncbi:BRO-N domain-containing protein [Pantoea agglomerans]|uniref:BRO-N domain-containing protein n=1 Tax=Enterobacter agglomerans TaxID=549 RepID=UPI0024137C80|nr:BRO family protein [Pantoea agglomerans]
MTALAINSVEFNFENHNIRTVIVENEPWFVAVDVCNVLGIQNPSKALKALDDDERSNFKLGRQGEANIINESGLYTLILRCRDAVKPGTVPHRFRKWITNEVLPTIRKTGRYEPKPLSEPLSSGDMHNLTHLVWMMTRSMKFSDAWNSGIWHCLRAATGKPSPQRFSVDDLPVLSEECRRILKITTAFNAGVYDFEKQVISKVLRSRCDIAPYIDQMNERLAELQQLEADGRLALKKLDKENVNRLISRVTV